MTEAVVHAPPCTDTTEYAVDNSHWALSSTTNSTCTVEPGTAEDVGKIVSIGAANDWLQGPELTKHRLAAAYPRAHPNTVRRT